VTSVVVVAPIVVFVVVVISPRLAPDVTSAVVPTLLALPHSVRSSIAPVKLPACLTVWRASNASTTLQEGEVFYYLEMVTQEVDMATLEVDWIVLMWRLPV
jgi:hypothetical protein